MASKSVDASSSGESNHRAPSSRKRKGHISLYPRGLRGRSSPYARRASGEPADHPQRRVAQHERQWTPRPRRHLGRRDSRSIARTMAGPRRRIAIIGVCCATLVVHLGLDVAGEQRGDGDWLAVISIRMPSARCAIPALVAPYGHERLGIPRMLRHRRDDHEVPCPRRGSFHCRLALGQRRDQVGHLVSRLPRTARCRSARPCPAPRSRRRDRGRRARRPVRRSHGHVVVVVHVQLADGDVRSGAPRAARRAVRQPLAAPGAQAEVVTPAANWRAISAPSPALAPVIRIRCRRGRSPPQLPNGQALSACALACSPWCHWWAVPSRPARDRRRSGRRAGTRRTRARRGAAPSPGRAGTAAGRARSSVVAVAPARRASIAAREAASGTLACRSAVSALCATVCCRSSTRSEPTRDPGRGGHAVPRSAPYGDGYASLVAAPRPARLRVGVVGVGRVGSALGTALARAGHEIVAASAVSNASGSGRTPAARALRSCRPTTPSPPPTSSCSPSRMTPCARWSRAWPTPDAWRAGQLVAHTSGAHGIGVLDPAAARGRPGPRAAPGDDLRRSSRGRRPTRRRPLRRHRDCATSARSPSRSCSRWAASRYGFPRPARPLYHAALIDGVQPSRHARERRADPARTRAGVGEPARLVAPLLSASLDNVLRLGDAALTGPVSRGDVDTVAAPRRHPAPSAPETLPSYLALARRTAARAHAAGRLTPPGSPSSTRCCREGRSAAVPSSSPRAQRLDRADRARAHDGRAARQAPRPAAQPPASSAQPWSPPLRQPAAVRAGRGPRPVPAHAGGRPRGLRRRRCRPRLGPGRRGRVPARRADPGADRARPLGRAARGRQSAPATSPACSRSSPSC